MLDGWRCFAVSSLPTRVTENPGKSRAPLMLTSTAVVHFQDRADESCIVGSELHQISPLNSWNCRGFFSLRRHHGKEKAERRLSFSWYPFPCRLGAVDGPAL